MTEEACFVLFSDEAGNLWAVLSDGRGEEYPLE